MQSWWCGEHLGVLAEVQEHRGVFVEGVLIAGLEAAGKHLGAAEEEQGELKNKNKRYLISEKVEKKCFSKLIRNLYRTKISRI